ncbi:MAG: hypothetical protein ACKO1I_02980, partial [Microcystis aeruginosa]
MSIPSKPESDLSCQPSRGDNPPFTIVKNQRQARINDADFDQLVTRISQSRPISPRISRIIDNCG